MEKKFEILKKRLNKLFAILPENSIILLESGPEKIRNNDVHYPYRQDSNTLFLTDCHEPNNFWAIEKSSGKLKVHMACKPEDKKLEQWIGAWVTPNNAVALYGVDEAIDINKWQSYLKELLQKFNHLWVDFSNFGRHSKLLLEIKNKNISLNNIANYIAELRMIKDSLCQHYLQRAIDVSSAAHIEIMQQCKSFSSESDIEGVFFRYIRSISNSVAYPTIAASGKNACVLHYTNNNQTLDKNDFILLDAGAEYGGYAADITRTFPVGGKFSTQQKDFYNVVLNAQKAAIDLIKPNISWLELERAVKDVLIDGCLQLNIFNEKALKLNKDDLIKIVFPHGLGHHLGLDVHDSCPKGRFAYVLEDGNVITIEPGLYLNNVEYIKPNWLNYGVRIEDDVLVCADAGKVLSNVPKTVAAIEDLMS
jgi:Xaa-Pro aminopeptidase